MGYEDWDLWLSLVERGHRGHILQEVLFEYRRRTDSMSAVCTRGDGHLSLMRYLFRKHRESYERYPFAALDKRNLELGRILSENWSLERRLNTELEPEVSRKRAEVARLRARLERAKAVQRARALEEETRTLRSELERARQEVHALRDSLSWKVTGPGRRALDVWKRWRNGKES
jgi:hypothetical protein